MKKSLLLAALLPALPTVASEVVTDTIYERAIILSGDPTHPGHIVNLAEMNSRINKAFEDPESPRFLFLDKQGKVALGIGGYLKAMGMYDFDGAIDDNSFVVNKIPVPMNPEQRQRFGATAAYSSIFLKMVAHTSKLGPIIVYLQTNFAGDGGNYGLTLKQAYVTLGHVTLGKMRSTFCDAPALAPTIDEQGPVAQTSTKNMQIQYTSPSYRGFSWGIAVEQPGTSYTLAPETKSISQRVPDIPAYVQYGWDGEKSHVRLSGLFRQMNYRSLSGTGKNHFATGWGARFSTIASLGGGVSLYGQCVYGKGIGSYINDLSGEGYDLIADGSDRLKAPGVFGYTVGVKYEPVSRLLVSATYSGTRLYDAAGLPGDTYRSGQYAVANIFYTVWGDLRFGLEYLHGIRKDHDGLSGHANRFAAAAQYSF